MSDHTRPDGAAPGTHAQVGNHVESHVGNPANPYDVPTNPTTLRVVLGWSLVGIPLLYGVITTLSKVGQLFG